MAADLSWKVPLSIDTFNFTSQDEPRYHISLHNKNNNNNNNSNNKNNNYSKYNNPNEYNVKNAVPLATDFRKFQCSHSMPESCTQLNPSPAKHGRFQIFAETLHSGYKDQNHQIVSLITINIFLRGSVR